MLLLAVWLGSGLFFMTVLAPTVFIMVPSRDLAGGLIGRLLEWVDLFGLVAGPLLMMTLLAGWLPLRASLRLRGAGVILMTLGSAVSGRFLTPQLDRLHALMGKIEEIDPSDPHKIEFGQLHAASTTVMALNVILALALLIASMTDAAPKKKFGIQL